LGVQFFFKHTKSEIDKSFSNIFAAKTTSTGGVRTDGEYKRFIKPYGWLNSLYGIAEKGVFTERGKNSIDSVKDANLYKVLTYMSWQTATKDFEAAINEKIRNPNKMA
tara:strand:+ start:138 stop:461 length:324 start_codon:yes stop_codon:yes gene_type:complete